MSYVDLAVLVEEMGRAVVPGPFFATVCLAAPVLVADTDAQKQTCSPASRPAERLATLAYTERTDVSTRPASSCRDVDGDGTS